MSCAELLLNTTDARPWVSILNHGMSENVHQREVTTGSTRSDTFHGTIVKAVELRVGFEALLEKPLGT